MAKSHRTIKQSAKVGKVSRTKAYKLAASASRKSAAGSSSPQKPKSSTKN